MDQNLLSYRNVTSLFQRRRAMKNPILIDLLDYWERLRAGRSAPLRSEIDPREIESALEHAFILERVSADNIRFRLAGVQLCDLLGMEIRGMPPAALFEESDRAQLATIVGNLFHHPEVVELELSASRPAMPPLKAEMLMLPMKSDQGEISRILGCLVTDGPLGPPPQRFSITSSKTTRIVATESGRSKDLLPGFAEAPQGFRHKDVIQPRNEKPPKPYLRLVKSDD